MRCREARWHKECRGLAGKARSGETWRDDLWYDESGLGMAKAGKAGKE